MPSNSRPIALLAHFRKVIEKVLDMQLRKEYQFNTAQCGSSPGRSIETAKLRARQAHEMAMNTGEVFDLKSAHQSVIRSRLMGRIWSKVNPVLAAQIN